MLSFCDHNFFVFLRFVVDMQPRNRERATAAKGSHCGFFRLCILRGEARPFFFFFFVGHPTERVQGTECQQEWGASMLMRQRLEPRVYFTSFFFK